jgi:hypothetical protein
MKIKHLLKNLRLSNKPVEGMKVYTMEGEDPDQPVASLYESQVHPSVFEANLSADHPVPHFDKAVFSWIAPEYLQHPKSARWWATAAVVLVIGMIIEAFTGNWTMLLATLTFGFVYWYMHEHHPPKHIKINISELGVKIGHRTVHFAEIEAFWILSEPPHVNKLYLRLRDKLLPDLIIELGQQNPQPIRAFLELYLTEIVGMREHLGDIILRIFKI